MGRSFWRGASAVTLIGSGVAALSVLASNAPIILTRLDAWHAVAVPLFVAVVAVISGLRLLILDVGPGSWFMVQAVFAVQVPAFSTDLVLYRLVVGPFLTVTLAGQTSRFGLHAGVDAHLLFIAGGASHLPFSVALNLAALVGLTAACMGFVEMLSVNESAEHTHV